MADAAKQMLEGKKRWVRISLDGARASDAEYKVKDFENAFEAAKKDLDVRFSLWGVMFLSNILIIPRSKLSSLFFKVPPYPLTFTEAAYVAETEKYIADVRAEVEEKLVVEEWTPKVSGWRSRLRRCESALDEYNPDRPSTAPYEFASMASDIDLVVDRQDLMVCQEFKTFAVEWVATIKPNMAKKVADVNRLAEWQDKSGRLQAWLTPLDRDIRNCLEKKSEQATNQLQQTAESARDASDKIDWANWNDFAPAQTLKSSIGEKIAAAYAAMDAADQGRDALQAAKATADLIEGCSSDIREVLKAGKCSFVVTKSSFKRQPYYLCHTCGDGYGVCLNCRIHCHPSEHSFSAVNIGDFYCDCGSSGKCKCLDGPPAAIFAPAGSSSADAATLSSTNHVFKCRNGHDCARKTQRPCRCDLCSSNVNESHNCAQCDFDMCFKCAAKQEPSPASAGDLMCRRNHLLALKAGRNCNCDECGAKSLTESYNCTPCDYDMCVNCAAKHGGAVPAPADRVLPPVLPASSAPTSSSVSSSAYKSDSFETWLPGTDRLPIGLFETSNRQCRLALKEVLGHWNSYARDFNANWEAAQKLRSELKSDDNLENTQRRLVMKLDDAEKMIPYFRTNAEQIAAVVAGGILHPAVQMVNNVRQDAIALVRDLREITQKETDALLYTRKLTSIVKNIRQCMKTGMEYKDLVDASAYIEGLSGSYRNYDIFRVALKEIAKARDLLRENPSHPLGVEIEQEEKVATQEQFDVCRKWGLEFAARGDKLSLERAQEYRDSLFGSLGHTALTGATLDEIDTRIAQARVLIAEKVEEEAKRALIENERAKEEAEGERRKLVELWHTPYTGGTVYCDQEVWTYTASGHAQCDGASYDWNGVSLSGDASGWGTWDGQRLCYEHNSRTIYDFHFGDHHFSSGTQLNLKWKWDGAVLTPLSDTPDKWTSRLIRFDGRVPVPVLLAIAMRPWAAKRCVALDGGNQCRSSLFSEGSQAKTCDNCSTNYRMRCAVCLDSIAFPQNAALICKYCVSNGRCVRCGFVSANTPAFLCDPCKFRFSGNCIRTTRYE